MTGFKVIKPGILCLLQDGGRNGYHHLGLTSGGPMDRESFVWSNRLCSNVHNSAAIEVCIGGLVMDSQVHCCIALTGADIPMMINGRLMSLWQSHPVVPGDRVELGYARSGVRGYLAVNGGFQVSELFGSISTVPRERIGGLKGDGSALRAGDIVRCKNSEVLPKQYLLPVSERPVIPEENLKVRIILGYQHESFEAATKKLFFASQYKVTKDSDRMGYRLSGPKIKSSLNGIVSEGICLGAIQVPTDGQPIILMSDHPTIGGYPKLGAAFSVDLNRLSQSSPGSIVRFEPIGIAQARTILIAQEKRFIATRLESVDAGTISQ